MTNQELQRLIENLTIVSRTERPSGYFFVGDYYEHEVTNPCLELDLPLEATKVILYDNVQEVNRHGL